MKKFKFLYPGILLLFLLNLSACSDDKNDENNIKIHIAGVWETNATKLIPSPTADGNIVVIYKDGTGIRYENATAYKNQSSSGVISTLIWNASDNEMLVSFIETQNPSHGQQVWEYIISPTLFSSQGILWKSNLALEYSWEWTKYK